METNKELAKSPEKTAEKVSEKALEQAPEKVSEKAVWYAMRATYRRESDAMRLLEKEHLGCFVPMQYKIVMKRGKKVRALVPVVHNLLFVHACPSDVKRVKSKVSYLQYITDTRSSRKIIIPDVEMQRFIAVAGTYNDHLLYFQPDEREVTAQELTQKESSKDGIAAGMSVEKIGLDINLEEGYETEIVKSISETTNFNVQELLSALGAIRRASKIDSIYVFIDEFSDLSDAEQKEFSELLKKLLGSKNNIFFKVGTITDRYDFGEKIIIGRDIFPIFLDLNDFVEKYGGIVTALKQLEDFTTSLVNKRLASYCPDVSLNAVFDEKNNEIIARITREAMGVPRTIGMILQGALNQTELNGKRTNITISDINVGIQETRKIYFSQFQGAVKKKIIPAFYMDMWNSILNKALTEKNKNKKEPRPSSHFMLDPLRKKYMNIFCENFLVHLLEESRASKYGGNYLLFSIDYGICTENNILFAEEKDEFTAARFIYDNIIAQYDCYFVDEQLKSYQCPICKRIYKEEDVAQAKVKRCFECDEKLIEIVHREVPMTEGNYTEVEVKILGLIGSLSEEEAMSASEIGDAIGCTWQKVSNWCSKVLGKQELINVKKVGGRNYYFDKE